MAYQLRPHFKKKKKKRKVNEDLVEKEDKESEKEQVGVIQVGQGSLDPETHEETRETQE